VAPILDANGQPVPQSWALYKGNSGTQPITCTTNAGAVTLTTSSYTSYPTDNPPGLTAICQGGPIVPGVTALSVSVELSGTAPGVYVQLAWYTSGGAYVSASIGGPVNLTGTPQVVTASGTAPATAAYAQVFIEFSQSTTTGGTMVVSPTATQRGVFAGPSGRVRFPLP
jgi:hypothetical protein